MGRCLPELLLQANSPQQRGSLLKYSPAPLPPTGFPHTEKYITTFPLALTPFHSSCSVPSNRNSPFSISWRHQAHSCLGASACSRDRQRPSLYLRVFLLKRLLLSKACLSWLLLPKHTPRTATYSSPLPYLIFPSPFIIIWNYIIVLLTKSFIQVRLQTIFSLRCTRQWFDSIIH